MEVIPSIVNALLIIGLIPLPFALIRTYGIDVVVAAIVIGLVISAFIFY